MKVELVKFHVTDINWMETSYFLLDKDTLSMSFSISADREITKLLRSGRFDLVTGMFAVNGKISFIQGENVWVVGPHSRMAYWCNDQFVDQWRLIVQSSEKPIDYLHLWTLMML